MAGLLQGWKTRGGPEEGCSPGSSPLFHSGACWWAWKTEKADLQPWHGTSLTPCSPMPSGSSREHLNLQLMVSIPDTEMGTPILLISFPIGFLGELFSSGLQTQGVLLTNWRGARLGSRVGGDGCQYPAEQFLRSPGGGHLREWKANFTLRGRVSLSVSLGFAQGS